MASVKGRPVMGEIEIDTLVSGFLGKKKASCGGRWVCAACVLGVCAGDRSLCWYFLISEGFTCTRGGRCRVILICILGLCPLGLRPFRSEPSDACLNEYPGFTTGPSTKWWQLQ